MIQKFQVLLKTRIFEKYVFKFKSYDCLNFPTEYYIARKDLRRCSQLGCPIPILNSSQKINFLIFIRRINIIVKVCARANAAQ